MSSAEINILSQLDNSNEKINFNNKTDIFQTKKVLNNIINNIKSIILQNINDNNISSEIIEYFIEINKIIENLINSLIIVIDSKNLNELIQRKEEQNLRSLYSELFHEKLLNEILENKIFYLNKKEKDFELLKQKTGAIICNGKVICNERKDNEIIILRTENSLLKTAIKNNEDLIKEKNDIINNLNNDILLYKSQIDEFRKMKASDFSSFSNINININESKNNYNKGNSKAKNSKKKINLKKNSSSSKKNKNTNNKENFQNNIYSSFQIKNQLINKINSNFSPKKNRIEKYSQNFNSSKNSNLVQNKTTGFSFKYISVNKSLFSPKKEIYTKNNIGNDYMKRNNKQSKNNKYDKNNSQILVKEYKTLSNQIPIRKEKKLKKNIGNNRIDIYHRKANSIQISGNSLKKIRIDTHDKKEKSLSNIKKPFNNTYKLFSVLRKISEIKNKSLKMNKERSYMTVDNLNIIKPNTEYLNYTVTPYIDKKNDNRGRNERFDNSKYFGDSSFSIMNKSVNNKELMNKTTYDSYS